MEGSNGDTTTPPSSNNLVTEKELFECDYLDLHLIGKIQGQTGHVLFVTVPLCKIVAVDANVRDLPFVQQNSSTTATNGNHTASPATAKELLGTSLQKWIPKELYQTIFESIQKLRRSRVNRNFFFSSGYAFTIASSSSDYKMVSIEIEEDDTCQAPRDLEQTLNYVSRIMELYADEAIVKTTCDLLFDLLEGYDRGMVYRFNDDLSGTIIHELRRPGLDSSYLGLRYPKYDIPLSARKLFAKNVVRYLRDVHEPDVPILSLQDQPMDLTELRTRAVMKPHLIYLKNMGVGSTLSLAIVSEGELWGLLAFHGYGKPFKPSLHQRICCETIASMVSVRVESLARKAQSARIIRMGETLMRWSNVKTVPENFQSLGDEILGILSADVLVGCIAGKTISLGDATLEPGPNFWNLFHKYDSLDVTTCSTRDEIQAMGLTQEDCPASGFIYFRQGTAEIFVGRAARAADVCWAGNPDQPKLKINGILEPRNSFAMYMEKARQECKTWSTGDLDIVLMLRDRVCSGQAHDWMTALLKSDIDEANMRYFNEADRARDNSQFFAHMCHELRTPFHAVLSALNLLHDSLETMSVEESKDLIETALSSGNHMINLLNDILQKSKTKYLSSRTVLHTVKYKTLAMESVASLAALARSMRIHFEHEVTPQDDTIVISTDRTKWIQVASNILNNALKFSKGGPVKVKTMLHDTLSDTIAIFEQSSSSHAGFVFTIREGEMLTSQEEVRKRMQSRERKNGDKDAKEEKTQWMVMSIADSGIGMKPLDLSAMFEPYVQGDRNDSKFQGTGLGLFICVSLCWQLGGFLACCSTPQVGTEFLFAIPVERVENGELLCLDETLSPAEKSSRIEISGPILIADDNKVNIKILKAALSREFKKVGVSSAEIITAEDGEQTFDLYKKRLPSLCVVDYQMPGMDGAQATRAIRKYEKDRKLRRSYIISYTADASDEARDLLMSVGSDEIMSKPPPQGYIKRLVGRMDFAARSNIMEPGCAPPCGS